MIEEVEKMSLQVDTGRKLVKKYYHEACHNPCSYTRGRAGWELYKANYKLRKLQREYVMLCDVVMSPSELYLLLSFENIKIKNL
jgi:hypothetical protein